MISDVLFANALKALAAEGSITDVAMKLGIAEPTAKTHRAHIYSKMGIKRRTDPLTSLARLDEWAIDKEHGF